MTGQLEPLSNRRLRDLEAQRDAAREIAMVLEECNARALELHTRYDWKCQHCGFCWPCPTRRALNGTADGGDVA